jgi:cytochrome c
MAKRMKFMSKSKSTYSPQNILGMAVPIAGIAAALTGFVLAANAADAVVGDADRGAEQFEATCAECHGAAATAPTLRGIINRPIASITSFYGYSEALKSKQPMTWTKESLNTYMKSPPTFAPGNLMYREYPDAQMRADIIAFLETLPPPR